MNLFFDLDNVAFSHHSCNVGAARQPDNRYDLEKDNLAECHKCKLVKNKSEFIKRRSRWNGVDNECKSCKKGRGYGKTKK